MPGHRLSRLQQQAHLLSLGFPSVPLVWDKTVSCRLCAGQSNGTIKRENMLFLDLAPPMLQKMEFSTIATVLTSTLTIYRRKRGDPSSIKNTTQGALHCGKNHSCCSGLAWSRPRADRGLSRPTSVFRINNRCLQNVSSSVEIWQYEGQKPVLE